MDAKRKTSGAVTLAIVRLLDTSPELWTIDRYTVVNHTHGIQLWHATGIFFYDTWPTSYSPGLRDRIRLYFAVKRWRRWNAVKNLAQVQ